MSYIRPGSNPEGLYIVGLGGGHIEIFGDASKTYPPEIEPRCIPRHVFHGLLDKWLQNWDESSFRGASLKHKDHTANKWLLNYKGWKSPVEMYEVTLHYIAYRYDERYKQEIRSL